MKRFASLLVALALVVAMAMPAAAMEVTTSGNLLVNAVWTSNTDFDKDAETGNNYRIMERADLYFTATANENLKGVLGLRSDRGEWGQGAFALGNAGGNGAAELYIRDAYLDFAWPGTEVQIKAGLYTFGLPQAVGGASFIHSDRSGAIIVTAPITENVGALVGYTRLFRTEQAVDPTPGDVGDETTAFDYDQDQLDALLVAAPLTFDGLSMSPFVLYAMPGKNYVHADLGLGIDTAYWVGTDFTLDLDPFVVKADLIYGTAEAKNSAVEATGYFFDAALEYKGFDFMNAEVFFAYSTGEDDDATESERILTVSDDWSVGGYFFGGGMITGDDYGTGTVGFWTIGLSLTEIQSFMEGLTHDVHLLYATGTNDKNAGGLTYGQDLTEDDSAIELTFNSMYQIYDELTLYGGISYLNLNTKEDNWANNNGGGSAYKISTGVVYDF